MNSNDPQTMMKPAAGKENPGAESNEQENRG